MGDLNVHAYCDKVKKLADLLEEQSGLKCFSLIQLICLPRLLISWMLVELPLRTCPFITVLSGHFSILPSLNQTLLLWCNRFAYLCMICRSHSFMCLSAFFDIFDELQTMVYSFMFPPRLNYVLTLMSTEGDALSHVTQFLDTVFFLVII